MVDQETILNIIREKGPLIPSQLSKVIGSDILIASAHLSYLVDQKKVFLTNTKIGGSPIYYLEEQKNKLQDFFSNLDIKDQKTFHLLKEKKVLKDEIQDQLTRISLRTIKDFAVPLQVIKDNKKTLFWKWYLASNQEAEELIKKEFHVSAENRQTEAAKEKTIPERTDTFEKEKQRIEEEKKRIEQERRKERETIEQNTYERKKIEEEKKLLEQKRTEQEKRLLEQRRAEQEKRALAQKRMEEEKKKFFEEKKRIEEEKKRFFEEKKKLQKQIELERQSLLKEVHKKKEEKTSSKVEDSFLNQLMGYFNEKKIEVIEQKILRKNAEIDLILKIPSVVGTLEYYCKAKNKKNISDTDLSSAVIQGQLKKLPVLFLNTGELTKKANELLDTELKRGLVVKRL